MVDLKTGRTTPADKSVADQPPAALYQYAVDTGALDESAGRPVASGGAELVQLGIDDDSAVAKVQPQPPHPTPGRSGGCATARAGRRPRCAPRCSRRPPGRHCRDCPFVAICPAKSAGSVTVAVTQQAFQPIRLESPGGAPRR